MSRQRKFFDPRSLKAVRRPADFYIALAIVIISVVDVVLYIENHPAEFQSIKMLFFVPDFSQIGDAQWSGGLECF